METFPPDARSASYERLATIPELKKLGFKLGFEILTRAVERNFLCGPSPDQTANVANAG